MNKGQSDSALSVITGTGANQSQWLQDENADRIEGKIKHTPGRAQKECLSWGYFYLPIISSYSLNLLHCSVIMRMSARA